MYDLTKAWARFCAIVGTLVSILLAYSGAALAYAPITRLSTLRADSLGSAFPYAVSDTGLIFGEPSAVVGMDPGAREFAFSVLRKGSGAAEFQLLASLPRASDVRLRVYDVRGRQVATVDAGRHAAGDLALDWSGRDDQQRRLGSGVYFVRFEARPVDGTGMDQATRKVVLVR